MYTMNCVFFDGRDLGQFFWGKNCPLAFDESEAKLKSKILSLIQFDFSCVCRCAERSLPFFPLRILCRSLESVGCYWCLCTRWYFSQKCTDLLTRWLGHVFLFLSFLFAFSSFLGVSLVIITNQLDCKTNLHDYCTK